MRARAFPTAQLALGRVDALAVATWMGGWKDSGGESLIQLRSVDLEFLTPPPLLPPDLRAVPASKPARPWRPVNVKPEHVAPLPSRDVRKDVRPVAARPAALPPSPACAKTIEIDALQFFPPGPQARARALWFSLSGLVLALCLTASLSRVTVTVKAPGILRAPNGLRSVGSVSAGAVTDVFVQVGAEVQAGQLVARLEEAPLRATLSLREHERSDVERDTREAARADAALLEGATAALRHQKRALQRCRGIHEAQLQKRTQRLNEAREKLREGAASTAEALGVDESVQAAAEAVALVDSQTAALELALFDRKREWKQRELERSRTLNRALVAVAEARSALASAELRAPAAGRVELLFAKPGSVLQPGAIVLQIVPKDAPRSIVAFLPARDAASVDSEAVVEVEALAGNESGLMRARVERLSTDIAQADEIALSLGEPRPGAFVRLELALLDDAAPGEPRPLWRFGERVTVRVQLREQRLLRLAFGFLRHATLPG